MEQIKGLSRKKPTDKMPYFSPSVVAKFLTTDAATLAVIGQDTD